MSGNVNAFSYSVPDKLQDTSESLKKGKNILEKSSEILGLEFKEKDVIDFITSNVSSILSSVPGGGKSTAGYMKVINTVLNYGISGREVQMLLYSSAGVRDAKLRFKEYNDTLMRAGMKKPILFSPRTIHSFCYSWYLSIVGKVELLGGSEEQMDLYNTFMSVTKDRSLDFSRVQDLLRFYNILIESNLAFEVTEESEKVYKSIFSPSDEEGSLSLESVIKVFTSVSRRRRMAKRCSFSDLLRLFHDEVVKDNSLLLQQLRLNFKMFIVDEVQDSTKIMRDIFLCISKYLPVFFVGDGNQSIYGFRGADLAGFLRLLEKDNEFGFVPRHLNTSRRCPLEVCNQAQLLMDSIGENAGTRMVPSNPDKPGFVRIAKHKTVLKFLIEQIPYLKDLEDSHRASTVIAERTSRNFNVIGTVLCEAGIPFEFSDSYSNKKGLDLKGICSTYVEFLENIILGTSIDSYQYFYKIFGSEEYPQDVIQIYQDTCNSLKDVKPYFFESFLWTDPKLKEMALKIKTFYYTHFDDEDADKNFNMNLKSLEKDFMEIVKDFKPRYSLEDHYLSSILFKRSLEEYDSYIKVLFNRYSGFLKDSGKLLVSTFHSIKGMEFEDVFLTSLSKQDLEEDEDGILLAEAARLFYVAITRSKRNLTYSFNLDSPNIYNILSMGNAKKAITALDNLHDSGEDFETELKEVPEDGPPSKEVKAIMEKCSFRSSSELPKDSTVSANSEKFDFLKEKTVEEKKHEEESQYQKLPSEEEIEEQEKSYGLTDSLPGFKSSPVELVKTETLSLDKSNFDEISGAVTAFLDNLSEKSGGISLENQEEINSYLIESASSVLDESDNSDITLSELQVEPLSEEKLKSNIFSSLRAMRKRRRS